MAKKYSEQVNKSLNNMSEMWNVIISTVYQF